ncbi:MAG TPA: hypothetical protein VMB73_15740 [Acetobacteraceae bacterium]|nr:hypothetical protein [Acetobacteraceae bacterium]
MADNDGYRQLSAHFLARAGQIKDPELQAIYIRLALAYEDLTQFHAHIKPLIERSEAGVDDTLPPRRKR